MKFELKNLRIVKALSEETTCFTATLWVNGRKVAQVSNRGTGGCNDWRWSDRAAEQAFTEQAKAAFPDQTFEQEDSLVARMMDRSDRIARFRRQTKTALVFRLKGDKQGVWKVLKGRTLASLREHLRKTYGDKVERIANDDIEAAVDFDFGALKPE